MKYKFQIYKIHLVFGHLSALFENITIKCATMESRLKHADWNFPQKTINVQDLIRACRVEKEIEIYKRACTFIRYSRVGTNYRRALRNPGSWIFKKPFWGMLLLR